MNGWQFAKGGPTTMGYLDRTDLPCHYALADHYTVGDAYHCSVLIADRPEPDLPVERHDRRRQGARRVHRLVRRRRAVEVPPVGELRARRCRRPA